MRMALLAMVLLTNAGACLAQELAYSGLGGDRQPAQAVDQAGYSGSPCATSGVCECLPCVSRSTRGCQRYDPWFAGADVGVTDVSYASSSFSIVDDETGVSVRPYLGWESRRGVGFRMQAWLFGANTAALPASEEEVFELSVGAATLDIDFYRRFNLDDTTLAVGAGVRSAAAMFEFPNEAETTVSGGGVSLFLEGYHPFRITECSEWALIGVGRISVLDGQTEFEGPETTRVDAGLLIAEAGLGVEYRRHLPSADLIFQVRTEVQNWASGTMPDITFATTAFRFGAEW